MNNNIISESIGLGFKKIFDLDKSPKTIEDLQSLIIRSHYEKNLERTILALTARHYIEYGSFPSLEVISKELQIDLFLVRDTLNLLESKGIVTFGENEKINGSYGVSGSPTSHSFSLDHKPIHVWCAIDSLGIPLVLNKHTKVHSKCSHCKSQIDIKIEGGKLGQYNHNIVMFVGFKGNVQEKVSEDFCPYINFFCSNEHLDNWKNNNPLAIGINLDLPTAAELSKSIFMPLGRTS